MNRAVAANDHSSGVRCLRGCARVLVMRRLVIALAGSAALALTLLASPATAVSRDPTIYRMAGWTGYDRAGGNPTVNVQAWLTNVTYSLKDNLEVHFVATYTVPGADDVVRQLDRGVMYGGTSVTTGLTVAWTGNSSADPVPDAALVPTGATALSVTAQVLRWSSKAKAFQPVGGLYTASGSLPSPWTYGTVFDNAYPVA